MSYEFLDEEAAMDEIDRMYNEGDEWAALHYDPINDYYVLAADLANALGTTWSEIETLPETNFQEEEQ